MIEIQVGSTPDEKIKLEKTFNIRTTINGEIFTPCSVESPQLIVSSDSVSNSDTYFYVPYFNRYYFLQSKDESGDITTLTLICDVLMSFKNDIRNCPLIAERSSNVFNGYLTDGEREFKNYSLNQYIKLGEFTGMQNWLVGV